MMLSHSREQVSGCTSIHSAEMTPMQKAELESKKVGRISASDIFEYKFRTLIFTDVTPCSDMRTYRDIRDTIHRDHAITEMDNCMCCFISLPHFLGPTRITATIEIH